MKILRTPDECFANLPDWPFEPHYTTITDADGTDIRVHHIDEGPRDAEPILLMHGNPTWSYLYRKMIPGLLETGRRVIAVDLVGLGRSDKPAKRKYYSHARHIDWMSEWLNAMALKNITLFCQDWGGAIGLHLVARYPERFDRVVVSNTGLSDGAQVTKAVRVWQWGMKFLPSFPLRVAIKSAIQCPEFSEDELKAYLAPYPSRKYEAAILAFPQLIQTHPGMPGVEENIKAIEVLSRFEKPFLTLFGTRDPITRGGDEAIWELVPGAKGLAHQQLSGAGHFTQEDKPEELVEAITQLLQVSSTT